MVAEQRFREDLFYRINVIPVRLPPLRERREDIPLARRALPREVRARRWPSRCSGISPEALALLQRYHWPGNIRELENVIERAVALERTPAILAESLPPTTSAACVGESGRRVRRSLPEQGFDLERHVRNLERDYIAQALEQADGVQVKAAELLGMSFRSFRYYAKKYNLT